MNSVIKMKDDWKEIIMTTDSNLSEHEIDRHRFDNVTKEGIVNSRRAQYGIVNGEILNLWEQRFDDYTSEDILNNVTA